MTKVKKVGGRGTISYEKDEKPENWAGDSFREEQKDRLKKTGKNITVHIGRGDRTMKLQDMPEPAPRPSTHGNTRITNRGTGSRKSKNAGTRTC
ncbi:uncharacterized protein METZ01_LOCUS107924 [marine metagenome]|jgi:hypothetical protein|uniref:Uncharacterized protein n=1 Tax=marine metagenome TaxID=408172 RepID=A0A381WRH7_9ZZZZ|tara:strand:- start:353 stop:634 length:282 start_codon:yes stop_codon:yes gene_type:complete